MSLSTTSSKNSFIPDGSTTVFPYAFRILANTDLEVILRTVAGVEQLQTLTTDYTVSGVGDATGGNVTMLVAPVLAVHDRLLIRRKVPRTQTLIIPDGSDIPGPNLEQRLDRAVMMIQELEERLDRSLHFQKATAVVPFDFPELVADKFVKVSSDGLTITLVDALTTGAISVTAFMQTLLDDIDGDAGMETLAGTGLKVGSVTMGHMSNLGITLSGGTLKLTDRNGATLTAANPGYVTVPSSSSGRPVMLKITTSLTLNDDSNASSHLTNIGFGVGETVDWQDEVPFFIGVVNRNDTDIDGVDGNSSIFLSRGWVSDQSPVAARIGDIDAVPATDDQNSIIIWDSITQANYANLPIMIIGVVNMKWSTATDDWTISALDDRNGLGLDMLLKAFNTPYDFPTGQNGGAINSHFATNGGTAPVFSTRTYRYWIEPSGWVTCALDFSGDTATDGAGAVAAQLATPYVNSIGLQYGTGGIVVDSSVTGDQIVQAIQAASASLVTLNEGNGLSMQNADFGNGDKVILGHIRFKAF